MIVGQNQGDNATLALFSDSRLNLTGTTGIVLGQAEGARGAIIFGADGANGAYGGFSTITGGTGGGTVVFNEALGAGGQAVYWFNPNLKGNLSVEQNGAGTTILNPGTANTYTGTTTVTAGTLQVGGNNALGTGAVTVSGGTLVVTGGTALSNAVTLSWGSYMVQVNEGGSYANVANATSGFGNGRATTASVQAGEAGAATMLATSFATPSAAANDALRQSDVYSFFNTGADIYVLELSMTSVAEGSYLARLNTTTNLW